MKIFLKVLEKLKKPSGYSNPEELDPMFCRYNKGWNDAIAKVEELICSYNVSEMWIPVDMKLPPEPNKDIELCDLPDYIVTIKGVSLPVGLTYIGGGRFADTSEERSLVYPVIAWMPMPEPYKEKKK